MHTFLAIARNSLVVMALLTTLGAGFVLLAKWLSDNSKEPGAH